MACVNCPPQVEPEYPIVIGWRIWFDDGAVADSTTHSWEELPDDGVLGVMLYESTRINGRRTRQRLTGYDTYFETTDRLTGTRFVAGNNDSPDVVKERYLDAVVKQGRWASPETLGHIQAEMNTAYWHDD